MPSQQNTYRKLDRDTAKNKVDKESMFNCRNMRLLGDSPNESGALVNMLGNEDIQTSFPGYTSDVVLGAKQIRDKVVLITSNSTSTTPSGTYGRIWTWDFKSESAPTNIYNGLLNLSRAHPIGDNIIARYESAELQKVYWADGYNNLRGCNIADPDLASKDPDDFNIVNDIDMSQPQLAFILGGKIPVGRVQYAYRLYKKNGPQTIFSPASRLINLTTENENASNTTRYGGADRLDSNGNTQSSGKSIQMSIDNIDSNFDKIEVVAIHYSEINEAPNIWIVLNTDVNTIVHFTDTGVYDRGFYTLSEYTALSNIFTPKTIATKNNIMFAGDVETTEFDVSYDARAYRYGTFFSLIYAQIHDSNGGYYHHVPGNDPVAYGPIPIITNISQIAEDFDCTQIINQIDTDPGGTSYKYQTDGSTLGGEGTNVKYTFKTTDHLIDNSGNDETFYVDGATVPYYFPSYASPFNSGSRLGYQRDEVYRFGIVFFSAKGQPSPVKWIGDIRMPNQTATIGATDNRHTLTLGGDNYGTRLYIEFTVDNIPSEAEGWQIVRVERKAEDRTILFQGKMSYLQDLAGFHRIPNPNNATAGIYDNIRIISGSGDNRITNLWLSSPEVSFYKDYKSAAGDYIQVIGYYANKNETNYGTNNWHRVNKYDTYNPIAYSSSVRQDINEGYVMEAPPTTDQEEILYNINGIPFSNTIRNLVTVGPPPLTQIADAGTAAVVNISSAFNLSALPSSSWPVINYRRPVIQYGGRSYEARLGNKYIVASDYFAKDLSSMTEDCYGGDTYVQFFDHLHGYWNQFYADEPTFDTAGYVDMFPVESTINLDLRHDDCWHRIYNSDFAKYNIREVGNASFTIAGNEVNPGWTDYYLYNTVFSRMENARLYIQVAADYDLTKHSDAMVIASNAKLNNEEIDAWSIWSINEFLEVDSGHGPIKYLVAWKNNLMFFQENAFGTLDVNERSLVSDSQGRPISIGEGGVLARYDIISSETGCSTRNSLIVTPNGIIWYDNKQKRLYRLLKSLENLGVIKGVNSYLKDINEANAINDNAISGNYKGFLMGYNSKFNEIWFTIKNGQGVGESLVFNEILDNFTGYVDNYFVFGYISQDDVFLSHTLYGKIYKENSTAVARCLFYDTIKDAIVEIIVNPAGTLAMMLNNLEFTTELIDASGNNVLAETLTEIQVTNDYQDTGVITLVPGTNVRRLLRTWRINTLRDVSTPARLVDTYAKIKLVHRNTTGSPRKIILHDLLSVYALPTEAIVNKK